MADQLANNGALLPVTADVDFEAKTKENERKLKAKGLKEVQPEFEVYDIGDLWTDEELKEMASSQKF